MERKEKKRQKQLWSTCIIKHKREKENGLGRVVPTKPSKIDFMKDEVVYGVKYCKGQAG